MTNTSMNMKWVWIGGIAAAAIQFVVNGIVNGVIVTGDFQTWATGMGSMIHPPSWSTSMVLWALMSLIYGWGSVWLYAGIRPRFGAGPKTALIAGFSVWILSKVATSFDFITLGVLPNQLIVWQLIAGFIGMMAGVFVGGWVYRE